MLILAIGLFVLAACLATALFFSIKKNLYFIDAFEEMQTQVGESLDLLDTCYQRVSAKASLELMSDDHVVQELVSDMKLSRDAILLVANKIVLTQQEETDKE